MLVIFIIIITIIVLYHDVRCGLLWGFVGRLRFPPQKKGLRCGIFHNHPIITVLLSPATQIVYKVVSEMCKLFSLESAKAVVLYMDSLTPPKLTEFLLGFVLRTYKPSPVALCGRELQNPFQTHFANARVCLLSLASRPLFFST